MLSRTFRSFIDLLKDQLPFMLAAPAYMWEICFLYVPVFVILAFSLRTTMSSVVAYSLQNYISLGTLTYVHILFNSLALASLTALICLLLGYPVAYYLAMRAQRMKNILLIFIILPSWTSFIIQIYSWFFLLQKGGLVSDMLQAIGLIGSPQNFMNNYGATLLGMVYCYLPFMIFPLYSVLEKMDKKLIEASGDLGANGFQTLRYVILPLSMPGVQIGTFLVFISAFGEFAIPDLMGGFKDMYIGRVVMEKFLLYRDWNSGAAVVMLSIILPMALILGVYVLSRLFSRFVSYAEEFDEILEEGEFYEGD